MVVEAGGVVVVVVVLGKVVVVLGVVAAGVVVVAVGTPPAWQAVQASVPIAGWVGGSEVEGGAVVVVLGVVEVVLGVVEAGVVVVVVAVGMPPVWQAAQAKVPIAGWLGGKAVPVAGGRVVEVAGGLVVASGVVVSGGRVVPGAAAWQLSQLGLSGCTKGSVPVSGGTVPSGGTGSVPLVSGAGVPDVAPGTGGTPLRWQGAQF